MSTPCLSLLLRAPVDVGSIINITFHSLNFFMNDALEGVYIKSQKSNVFVLFDFVNMDFRFTVVSYSRSSPFGEWPGLGLGFVSKWINFAVLTYTARAPPAVEQ